MIVSGTQIFQELFFGFFPGNGFRMAFTETEISYIYWVYFPI